jgi:hypothetical protein
LGLFSGVGWRRGTFLSVYLLEKNSARLFSARPNNRVYHKRSLLFTPRQASMSSSDRLAPYRGGGSTTRRSSTGPRTTRSESAGHSSLREAMLQATIRRGEVAPPAPGAPPRTGKPASAGTSSFLNSILMKIEERQMEATDAQATLASMRARKSSRGEEKDYESLKDDIYRLKKELLAFRTERDLLRSKIHHLEGDLRARNADLDAAIAMSQPGTARVGAAGARSEDAHLVTALKQQVRQ